MNEKKIIIDIETEGAPPASLSLAESFVRPHAGTKDFIKKEKQVAEKKAKLQEDAALIDGAPVVIVGILADGQAYQFHASDQSVKVPGVTVFPCKSEEGLLWSVKFFLEGLDGVCFVGHNIEKSYSGRGFDLPHLRFRYAFHNIPAPACMSPLHTRSLDLMELYFRSSTTKKDVFVSLEEMSLRLGIAEKPFPFAGKDVPGLWHAEWFEACLLKNFYDLLLTQQVFSRLIS